MPDQQPPGMKMHCSSSVSPAKASPKLASCTARAARALCELQFRKKWDTVSTSPELQAWHKDMRGFAWARVMRDIMPFSECVPLRSLMRRKFV